MFLSQKTLKYKYQFQYHELAKIRFRPVRSDQSRIVGPVPTLQSDNDPGSLNPDSENKRISPEPTEKTQKNHRIRRENSENRWNFGAASWVEMSRDFPRLRNLYSIFSVLHNSSVRSEFKMNSFIHIFIFTFQFAIN